MKNAKQPFLKYGKLNNGNIHEGTVFNSECKDEWYIIANKSKTR